MVRVGAAHRVERARLASAAQSTGPMWSKSLNAPTIRRFAIGSSAADFETAARRAARTAMSEHRVHGAAYSSAMIQHRPVPPEPSRQHRRRGARDEDHGPRAICAWSRPSAIPRPRRMDGDQRGRRSASSAAVHGTLEEAIKRLRRRLRAVGAAARVVAAGARRAHRGGAAPLELDGRRWRSSSATKRRASPTRRCSPASTWCTSRRARIQLAQPRAGGAGGGLRAAHGARRRDRRSARVEKLATVDDLEGLYAHLEEAAMESGFMTPRVAAARALAAAVFARAGARARGGQHPARPAEGAADRSTKVSRAIVDQISRNTLECLHVQQAAQRHRLHPGARPGGAQRAGKC